jgi:preprotein translocase SecE subunit
MATVDVRDVRADIAPEPTPQVEPGGSGLRSIFFELRRVVWPTRQELIRMTTIVIGTVVVIATFIGVADVLLNKVTIPIYGGNG